MSEEQKELAFNWICLFFVTSFSFFLFGMAVKILDGNSPAFMNKIGVIAFVLGLISWANKKSKKSNLAA